MAMSAKIVFSTNLCHNVAMVSSCWSLCQLSWAEGRVTRWISRLLITWKQATALTHIHTDRAFEFPTNKLQVFEL